MFFLIDQFSRSQKFNALFYFPVEKVKRNWRKMATGGALVVAAIDFGTTYSGWAFSFRHDFERDPTKVSAKIWRGGQLSSLKGPTCVLIQPDGRTLETFGFEAETRYSELAEQNQHKHWFYFRRFKMRLWEQGVDRNTQIEDECGKKLLARTVFALSIRFLKDELLKMSMDQIGGEGLGAGDVHWVITVPAIWNDAAKQFMREAAEETGIAAHMLTIALEPEAASIYCRHLPIQKSTSRSLSTFGPGKRYLVLDAGGGTVDITVHEVGDEGDLRELHRADGGAWGGTRVDEAFLTFLANITGSKVMDAFKDQHMEDYIDLMLDFEVKKRDIRPEKDTNVTIKCPLALVEMVRSMKKKEMNDMIAKSKFAGKVRFMGDKLRMDHEVAKSFFQMPIGRMVEKIEQLLNDPANAGVEAILMVGGFSDSPLLQDAVRSTFPKLMLIIPPEAGLAVLKGAVIFGHSPQAISQRVSKYTYGIETSIEFDEDEHPEEYMFENNDGECFCGKIFDKHVEKGEAMQIGAAQFEQVYSPTEEDQEAMTIDIYVTEDEDVEFVDEPGCVNIGSFTIPLAGSGTERKVTVRMIFGGTEIDVECTEEDTGEVSHLAVDFLP